MTRFTPQQKAFLFAITAVLFWSTVPTAFKLGLRYQDNYQMVSGAAIISTLILGLTVLLQRKASHFRRLTRRDLGKAAALGLLNPAFYYIVLFKAYELLPGQVAQPLNMTWPIVLVLISIPMLKQRISLWSVFAMIISFSGVITLSWQGGTILQDHAGIRGVLLALASAFLWAFYWIFNMKNRLDEVVGLFLVFAFSSLYLVAGGVVHHPGLPVGPEAWATAAYIGIFEMGFAFVLWLKALQLSTTTARISNLVYIAPFINLILISQILGENIYISTIFGIVLVVSGIILQNTLGRKHG